MEEERFYWQLIDNKQQLEQALRTFAGGQAVTLVDEVAGGIVGYLIGPFADDICNSLNERDKIMKERSE